MEINLDDQSITVLMKAFKGRSHKCSEYVHKRDDSSNNKYHCVEGANKGGNQFKGVYFLYKNCRHRIKTVRKERRRRKNRESANHVVDESNNMEINEF